VLEVYCDWRSAIAAQSAQSNIGQGVILS
jgi:hypothetical protein